MNVLLSLLQKSPDYMQLLQAVEAKQAAAVSGLSQAPRSHVLAALHEHSGRPLVAVCQDDLAASRLASELGAFLGEQPPVLPSRELTLAGAIGVSRQWEQKRLRLLYALAQGQVPVLVTSLDALLLRTMPREVLFSASVRLRCGAEYNVDDLVARLTRAGYTRSSLVEGVGQFALRGGILDVYSPACENPLRAEFFGDELDTMGYFDPITQRRTENVEEAVLLPVAETEAHLHPQGTAGLCEDLRAIIARQQRRKTPNQALIDTLQKDCEALENETLFASADRYMALIYPEFTTAAAYLSQEAVVAFCDHGNLQRAEKEKAEEFGLLLDSFLTSGTLFGELCDYYGSIEDLAAQLRGRAVVYCDGFLAARYPESLPPKKLLSFTARQLPGYGGSLETAASDLKNYTANQYGSIVLCGGQRRGEILKDLLAQNGLNALLAFPLTKLPQPGQILLAPGSLPAGLEYPTLKFAILTEGQIAVRQERKKTRAPKKATNRKKLDSFTDLTPGDLVVHEHHGIGRYVGMEQLKVGGVRSPIRARTACTSRPRSSILSASISAPARIRPCASTSSAATSGRRRRPRPRPRPRIWPRASSSSTLKESGCRASPSRRIRRGSRNLRRALNTRRPTISCAASTRSSAIWSRRRPWTGCSAATSASARRRSPCGRP